MSAVVEKIVTKDWAELYVYDDAIDDKLTGGSLDARANRKFLTRKISEDLGVELEDVPHAKLIGSNFDEQERRLVPPDFPTTGRR